MQIDKIELASLVEDPANARKHSERNIEAIKGSLAKFGQQKPIVVDWNNVVVAGNGTIRAARALGWHEIDAVRTGLKGSELTAFAIADNRSAELAEWDPDILNASLTALALEGINLDALGWNVDEYLKPVAIDDEEAEESAEPPKKDIKYMTCPHCNKQFAKG